MPRRHAARITQTITSIIAANTTIHQGDVLYTIDGAPVVALDGALPAWRSLSTSSADGADIAQLEASLVALGYDPAQKVVVDNHFDSATRTMVKAWQQGLGIRATGTVPLGSVVFLPTCDDGQRGIPDGRRHGRRRRHRCSSCRHPVQEVVIDVPTGDEAKVVPGLQVKIGDVQGTVSRLRSADRNGSVVVEAVIAPGGTHRQCRPTAAAVKVGLTLQNDTGALIAPAEALVSRLDGTYAVQVQTSDGSDEVADRRAAGGQWRQRGTSRRRSDRRHCGATAGVMPTRSRFPPYGVRAGIDTAGASRPD